MSLPIEIDCQSIHARLKAGVHFLLLDCRETDEWETCQIEGATLIPMGEIEERVAELELFKETEIAVHCHHGGRSFRVVNWLREHGYEHAQSMAGGIDEWSQTIDDSVPRY